MSDVVTDYINKIPIQYDNLKVGDIVRIVSINSLPMSNSIYVKNVLKESINKVFVIQKIRNCSCSISHICKNRNHMIFIKDIESDNEVACCYFNLKTLDGREII